MNAKRKMPCKVKIKEYWEGKFRFIEDFGWEELPIDACWRCGQKGYVERAEERGFYDRAKMLKDIHIEKTKHIVNEYDVSNLNETYESLANIWV